MKFSFVIPCYRSASTLPGVIEELRAVMATRPECDYEVIMVCDCSPDNVYEYIAKACKDDPLHLKGMLLARNFGQDSATMAGYRHVTGDYVVTLDDDGQFPLESIYAMADKLRDGNFDVVYGYYPQKMHNKFRNFGTWLNEHMIEWLIGKPKGIRITRFSVARRFVIDQVIRYDGAFPYIWGLFLRNTQNIANQEVIHRVRAEGESTYTFAKLLGLWLNGFTAFSVKPLRVASFLGAVVAVAGFGYGIWTVINKLLHPEMQAGYSSLMTMLLLVGGVLMLMLGMIGEYVGRIYISINRDPQFVIREKTF